MRLFRPHHIPTNVHPIVRKLFELMHEERLGVLDMSERSGINRNTIKDWKARAVPNIVNLDAFLNTLGYELAIRRKKDS